VNRSNMTLGVVPKVRCAIYTRKSSEEGLEQSFNSLDAQGDACAQYIQNRRDQGWIRIADRYDDGGYSGGTTDRPGLQRLLQDIKSGRIQVVVVYKIDRVSRSLLQFLQLVEQLKSHGVEFVSVTEAFETATPQGRAMSSTMMAFAQLEREMTGERIRDKIAASRKRGIWMGGYVPLGFKVIDRKLIAHEMEAATVRMAFERFLKTGSATTLAREFQAEGITTRRGKPIDKGFLYKLLNNRVYIGDAVHKGTAYPGEHKPIISRDLWDQVHSILKVSPRARAAHTRGKTPALLKGLIFGPTGCAMSPTHTRRRGKLYRYYVSQSVLKGGAEDCPVRRVPADQIETAIVDNLRVILRAPEVVVETWRASASNGARPPESDVRKALEELDALWDQLFPAEQTRIVQLLVERIDVDTSGMNVRLRMEGLRSLADQIRNQRAAAP